MAQAHPPCPRCYSQEEVIRPWRGFKVIRNLWVAGMCIAVLLMPLVAMDIVITMPLLMVYALAAGPVFGMAAQDPKCRECGLARPSPGWHETPVRPVPTDEPKAWKARNHAATSPPGDDHDEVSGLRRLPSEAGRDSDGSGHNH